HRLHALIEVVDVDLKELALGDRALRHLGLAGQIGHDAHDERQLHFLLGAVDLDVVLDLHPRGAVAPDEFLPAVCHVPAPCMRLRMLRGTDRRRPVRYSSELVFLPIPPISLSCLTALGARSSMRSRKSMGTKRFT